MRNKKTEVNNKIAYLIASFKSIKQQIRMKIKIKKEKRIKKIYNKIKQEAIFTNETIVLKSHLKKIMKDTLKFGGWLFIYLRLFICIFIIIVSLMGAIQGQMLSLLFIFPAVWGITQSIGLSRITDVIGYEFYEESFNIILKEGIFNFNYDNVEKIIEYDNLYYIFLLKTSIFIDKNGFINGSSAEWLLYMKNKCDFIYEKIEKNM